MLFRSAAMLARVNEVDETLSARMIEDTLALGGTWSFGSHMAQQHAEEYGQHQLSPETLAYFDEAAQQSLQRQHQLEQEKQVSFEQYLSNFR